MGEWALVLSTKLNESGLLDDNVRMAAVGSGIGRFALGLANRTLGL